MENFKKKLIQTEESSVVYGPFKGNPEEELFRCPRELDNVDLRKYVNETCSLLGFEPDTEDDDLQCKGYFRMYFSGRWYGTWMNCTKLTREDCVGVEEIVNWFEETFPNGCDYCMKDYMKKYPTCKGKERYLLRPILSDRYKVMVDTEYGNGDYPIRIYVYNYNYEI